MKEVLFLAIDMGLTNIKMSFFNEKGEELFKYSGKCSINYFTSDGLINPEIWWKTVLNIFNSIPSDVKKRVYSLCVIGQGPTIIPIDDDGHVYSAIPWLEKKGNSSVRRYMQSGYDGQTATVLSKLDYFSHMYEKPVYLLQLYDYIVYMLTGEIVNCSYDKDGYKSWDSRILESAGFSNRYRVPKICEPATNVSFLKKDISSQFGFNEKCKVISGAPDFVAGLIGTGVIYDGMICDRGGTSQGVTLCSASNIEVDGVFNKPFMFDDLWKISGVMNTSGKSIEWFCNSVIKMDTDEFFSRVNGDIRDYVSDSDLIFLPYLNGERSPYWDDSFRGVFFGLDTDDDWYSMGISIMQGVCYSIKDIISRLRKGGYFIRSLRETGKQSMSDLWNQMKSDVLGMEIEVTRIRESELLGAAIWCMSDYFNTGIHEIVRKVVMIEKVFFPNLTNTEKYERLFETYLELVSNTKSLFRKLK